MTILFEFYEKPMATNLMVQADSALSRDVKISSLAEEVTRRLRNTSLEVDITRRLAILEEVCIQMKTSGHKESYQRGSIKRNPEFQQKVSLHNHTSSISLCSRSRP